MWRPSSRSSRASASAPTRVVEATVGKIIVALSQHAVIEEQVFYPGVPARMTNLNEDVLEALEEHHVVKWTLSELEKMTSEDERYEAKVTVLMESVRHHVKEEEKGLFPQVRKALEPHGAGGDGRAARGGQEGGADEAAPAEPRHAARERRRRRADGAARCGRQRHRLGRRQDPRRRPVIRWSRRPRTA